MKGYWKAEWYRCLTSWEFWISIIGIAGTYFITSYISPVGGISVYETYYLHWWKSFGMLVYLFGTFSYAHSLREDMETGFYDQAIARGSLTHYVRTKCVVCFGAACFVQIVGTISFCLLYRFHCPWIREGNDAVQAMARIDCFKSLIGEQTILFYFLCSSAMTGLLSGLLALLSMWCSLFFKNRMFQLTIPLISFYFLENVLTEWNEDWSIYDIFISSNSFFSVWWKDVMLTVLVTGILFVLLFWAIYYKVEREEKK